MASIDAGRSDLSKTLLIACDQSYKANIEAGSVLAPQQDSSEFGDLFPNTMPPDWSNLDLSSWTVVPSGRTDIPQTGFGATIYGKQNADGTNDYIVAMQGTRGPNIQDWGGNLIYGWDKWSNASIQGPNGFLDRLDALSNANAIHFTGQSLGGALAEYAVYDFILRNPNFAVSRITLTTFNGLGTIDAFKQNVPGFEPSIVADVDTAHFWITNDIVSHLGGGHLNGEGHEYLLDFKKANNRGVPLVRDDNSPIAVDLIHAHRIEAGFYRGFNLAAVLPANGFPADFTQAVPAPIIDLGIAELARTGTYLAWLTNQDGALSSTAEASARTAAAVLASTAFGPSDQFEALVIALADRLYASNQITKPWRDFIVRTLPPFLTALANSPSGVATEMAAESIALLVEAGGNTPDVQIEEGFADRLAELISQSGIPGTTAFPVQEAAESAGVFLTRANGLSKTDALFKATACMAVALGLLAPSVANAATQTAVSNIFRLLTQDVPDIVVPLCREVSRALGQMIGARSAEFLAVLEQVHQSITQAVLDVSQATSSIEAQTLVGTVEQQMSNGLAEIAKSLSNAYGELTLKFADAFEWGAGVDRQSLTKIISSLLHADSPSTADSAFEDALDVLQAAAQTVVIRRGIGANPFDDETFDPEMSSGSDGEVSEGSFSAWTVYLPYEAAEGGQRIALQLAGADATKLSILTGGEAVDVAADGTFTVTVAQGSREATIEIAALADVDADETFTLSATLVNAAGEATHLTHEEAQIDLRAEAETPPDTALEIHGDWAPKPYTDPLTGDIYYRLDEFGNIERNPGVANNSFAEPDDLLDGSGGADYIVASDFEEVSGYAGDDAIYGTDLRNSVFFGGAGNDWMEAGRYDQHADDYVEFDYLGRTIRLGEDKLYGGAGDDHVYGESENDVANLYDANTIPTGLPGDWASGGSGDDEVYGGAGDDVLMGGAGEDLLVGGAGMDVLVGDDHFLLRPEGNFWTVVHPNFGDATAGFGDFEVGLFPVVNASLEFPDFVSDQTADSDFTYYKDAGAADTLIGNAGKDILIAQSGDDVLYGGEDDDILAGWEGADQIVGGAGDDLMAGDFGRYEAVDERRLDGTDLVRPGVLGSQAALGTPLNQAGDDFLDGAAGNDRIWGEGGDDQVLGGDGNDVLFGDATYLPEELQGADRIDGGAGDDALYGGGADDRLFGGTGNDTVSGEAGNDVVDGGIDDDRLYGGDGDDVLQGGVGMDLLAGDAGGDALHGGDGDDHLDGGDGQDTLEGGAGDDVLEADAGDDVLIAGIGNDTVRGGPGNDVYVFALGSGKDRIEDDDGSSVLRFSDGIAPARLVATLEAETLTAVLNYGFAGDDVSVALDGFHLGELEFSDGTHWSEKQLLSVVPALIAEGSDDDDALEGSPFLRNDLRGFEGNDSITGSANDDRLEGGSGADVLAGGEGGDTYAYAAGEDGLDTIDDPDVAEHAYLDWYYGNLGIADWPERAQYGGQYKVADAGAGGASVYFATYEEAAQSYPEATIDYVTPLPEAPRVRRDDLGSVESLRDADVLPWDVVTFGDSLSLGDLTLVYRVNEEDPAPDIESPWHAAGILSVRWNSGAAGFDVSVPDVDYGSGSRLGEGVEAFSFADGSSFALEELLQRATVVEIAPPYRFSRSSAEQGIARNVRSIEFEESIRSSEVAVSRDGADLVLQLADGSSGRIAGWYADPANMPVVRLDFAFDESIEATALTEAALVVSGTDDGEVLQGLDGFADTLYAFGGDDTLVGGSGADQLFGFDGRDVLVGGSGDDTLDGGAAADVFMLERGMGHDRVIPTFYGEPLADDVLRAAPDLAPADLLFSRDWTGLSAWIRGSEDRIELGSWFIDPQWRVAGIEFADGTVLSADEMEARLEAAPGTPGDDVILGGSADDILRGGQGDDDLEDSHGHNVLDGGAGDDYLYHEGRSFLTGGTGDDFLESGGANSVIAFNFGDGNDTIYATDALTLSIGGGSTPEDLTLAIDGSDLLLYVGTRDSIRLSRQFEDDPAAWPEITLQTFGSAHLYDFNAVIGQLYAQEDPAEPLSLGAVLPPHELQTSESEALGGALAWWYAHAGRIDGLTLEQVRAALADPHFGSALQPAVPDATNHAPVVSNPIADQAANEDSPFSFSLGAHVFADADGDALSLSADLASGDPLPSWLGFNATIGSFTGTPANADVGPLAVRVTATDARGASISDQFAIDVLNTNDVPMVGNAIPDQITREGKSWSFVVPVHTFADEDQGDSLVYRANIGNGSALPGWISFDAATRTFTGMPTLSDGGEYSITLTVSDTAGATVSTLFDLVVTDSLAIADRIIGTAVSDVLNGTSADEQLDGRRGSDQLLGGGGNDVLQFFADGSWSGAWRARNAGSPGVSGTGDVRAIAGKNRSLDLFDGSTGFDALIGTEEGDAIFLDDGSAAPRLAGIELIDAGGGRDVVDLTSRRFAYSDVAVAGGPGDDVLWTSSGNDVLVGGQGDDALAGGAGNDVYVYALGDKHDTISDTGGADTLLFGDGIEQSKVRLERHHDDLVVRVGDAHGGSATIAGWFASGANRVERFEFADGTAWDTHAIDGRPANHRGSLDAVALAPVPEVDDIPSSHTTFVASPIDRRDDGYEISNVVRPPAAQPLLISIADQESRLSPGSLTAASEEEIAQRWAVVHQFAQRLSYEDDDMGRAMSPEWRPSPTDPLPPNSAGFGFEASLGRVPAPTGLEAFSGLSEGFTRL